MATIYQETDLVEELTVAESMFLGHEVRRWSGSWTAGGCGGRRPRSSDGSARRRLAAHCVRDAAARPVNRWSPSHKALLAVSGS